MIGEADNLIRRWGRRRRLRDSDAERAIQEWSGALSIVGPVRRERVAPRQVMGFDGRRGGSLVGVVATPDGACIYHTRALTTEDIMHELLHVAHPDWSEAQVVAETSRALGGFGLLLDVNGERRASTVGLPGLAQAVSAPWNSHVQRGGESQSLADVE